MNGDLLSRFIGRLRRTVPEITSQQVADILWLAEYIDVRPENVLLDKDKDVPATTEKPIPPHEKRSADRKRVDVYRKQAAFEPGTGRVSGRGFQAPAGRALPDKLDIARAFRPLMRRVPSRIRFDIDEEKTARRVAETGNWTPKLRPRPSRWFELVILAEDSPSMIVWQNTLSEFKALMERLGAFRNVRTFRFKHKDGQAQLAAGFRRIHDNRIQRRFSELVDPAGRRLIMTISDGVSEGWHKGAVPWMMGSLGRNALSAVIQLLPRRLWSRTGLGSAGSIHMKATRPATPNASAIKEREWSGMLMEDRPSVCVPVVTLEPESIRDWTRYLAGGGTPVTGKEFFISCRDTVFAPPKVRDLPPLERARLFRASASPTARLLAAFFSVVPLSLPIMRIIQQQMLPKSRQVHLAEVMLSGMFENLDPIDTDNDPDLVGYQIFQDARPLMMQDILFNETLQVIEAVARFIEQNPALCGRFTAVFPDPEGRGDDSIKKGDLPVTSVKIQLLRNLGGVYARLAERLEKEERKPEYPRRREPIIATDKDFKEKFGLGENRRPLEYVKNEYEDHGDGTVSDYATGLMWEKGGSGLLDYGEALDYVKKLNQKRFAGYNDWRLPTIDELTSLLEPEEKNQDLYIDPVFEGDQWWCWSSDKRDSWSGPAWVVHFDGGHVGWGSLGSVPSYVRSVRSRQ